MSNTKHVLLAFKFLCTHSYPSGVVSIRKLAQLAGLSISKSNLCLILLTTAHDKLQVYVAASLRNDHRRGCMTVYNRFQPTSPSPGSGIGTSSYFSWEESPYSCTTTAFIDILIPADFSKLSNDRACFRHRDPTYLFYMLINSNLSLNSIKHSRVQNEKK